MDLALEKLCPEVVLDDERAHDPCAICQEELGTACELPCGHLYHRVSAGAPQTLGQSRTCTGRRRRSCALLLVLVRDVQDCLKPWLQQQASCPICRVSLLPEM